MSKQKRTRRRPQATEEPIIEVSLEELDEATEAYNREEAANELFDTQHMDGSTTDPHQAQDQGLVYTPPDDPPVVPSDDLQGAEVGVGFASSMEESNPDVEVLPPRVDNNDLDLEEDIATTLRLNSETAHLDNIKVRVRAGIAYLHGAVFSNDDIGIVQQLVEDLDGIVDVVNNLHTTEAS
ncbi:MAG: BON domain-containing protein [Caldilineaceae bacterium]